MIKKAVLKNVSFSTSKGVLNVSQLNNMTTRFLLSYGLGLERELATFGESGSFFAKKREVSSKVKELTFKIGVVRELVEYREVLIEENDIKQNKADRRAELVEELYNARKKARERLTVEELEKQLKELDN